MIRAAILVKSGPSGKRSGEDGAKGDGESDASGPLGADGCGCKAAGNRAPAGGLAALGERGA